MNLKQSMNQRGFCHHIITLSGVLTLCSAALRYHSTPIASSCSTPGQSSFFGGFNCFYTFYFHPSALGWRSGVGRARSRRRRGRAEIRAELLARTPQPPQPLQPTLRLRGAGGGAGGCARAAVASRPMARLRPIGLRGPVFIGPGGAIVTRPKTKSIGPDSAVPGRRGFSRLPSGGMGVGRELVGAHLGREGRGDKGLQLGRTDRTRPEATRPPSGQVAPSGAKAQSGWGWVGAGPSEGAPAAPQPKVSGFGRMAAEKRKERHRSTSTFAKSSAKSSSVSEFIDTSEDCSDARIAATNSSKSSSPLPSTSKWANLLRGIAAAVAMRRPRQSSSARTAVPATATRICGCRAKPLWQRGAHKDGQSV